MRALQALVIILGVLLLAGTATVAVTIVSRLAARGHGHGTPAAPGAPSRADLLLPADTRIESVSSIGDRILLHVTIGDSESLLVVDPLSGVIRDRLDVRRSAATAP